MARLIEMNRKQCNDNGWHCVCCTATYKLCSDTQYMAHYSNLSLNLRKYRNGDGKKISGFDDCFFFFIIIILM